MLLRDYQKAWLSNLREHYTQGSRAPLGQLPTGAGKTVCMGYAADGVTKKGNHCGITVHRQELVMQTSMTLAGLGLYHNIIAPSEVVRACIKQQELELGRIYFNSSAPTHVASIQTLARRQQKPPLGFLMIDEAHHAVAGQWRAVLDAYPTAYLLGVTATPERLDGKGLGKEAGGVFTSLVTGPTTAELMEAGHLSPYRIFAPAGSLAASDIKGEAAAVRRDGLGMIDFSGVKQRMGDYDRKGAEELVDKPTITGDAIAHYRRICDGAPALVFCISVEHAKHVADQFAAAGYRARCVDGGMDDAARRSAIHGLGNGLVDIVTSCEIINEGTDVPVCVAAILLRPTKSLGLCLQQIGRVLRPAPGKACAYILDHVGNSIRHGLPDDEREWSLAGKSKRKGREGDGGPAVRTCRECYAIFSAMLGACPACGAPFQTEGRTIDQVEGELIELTRDQARAMKREAERRQKWQRKREQEQATTLNDLVRVAINRGMTNPHAWAKHVLNARAAKASRHDFDSRMFG